MNFLFLALGYDSNDASLMTIKGKSGSNKIADTPKNSQDQIKAYEAGMKETDQVIAIQNHTSTVANLLFLITTAVWTALHTKELAIPPTAAAGVSASSHPC